MTKDEAPARSALKLALEALEKLTDTADGFSVSGVYFNEQRWEKKCLDDAYDAIATIRSALTSVPDWAEPAIKQDLTPEQPDVWVTPKLRPLAKLAHERERVAQQQEPVAWRYKPKDDGGWGWSFVELKPLDAVNYTAEPLYTSPPTLSLAQRQSRSDVKPLTNEHIERIYNRYGGDMMNCARAIEREHGIYAPSELKEDI